MRIKFCGITNTEDAVNAINLGVDALGFIFYEDSPRSVIVEHVQEIIYYLPPFITTVGVFVNAKVEDVNLILSECKLDMAQLHGDESPEYCMKVDARIIKAIHVSDMTDIEKIGSYQGLVSGIVLDTKSESGYGGNGLVFDWGLALAAKDYDLPLILSGGVNVDNLSKAIQLVNPHAIDVASGIEVSPGKKDYNKMKEFMSILK
ncbi:phosphoribosylanthranilate isomerase [Candidatus Marinamargulisbacteria bacterium SCGC AG-333-B06]|nr:phosphoribosylanthranilate isomerase [Candidatus Marinamargulisbacteria bacterium SCGC AG-333-B06]